MKSVKTKKFLGGVAIAAVSLGCLGLAGIANANPATPANAGTPTNNQGSGAYQVGTLTGAMSGDTTITANISTAQTMAGQKLSNHTLKYVQIGSYIGYGTSFSLSATNQQVEDAIYSFLTASAADGGLKQAFPNASYTAADGEALSWLMTGNNSGTFLGADASGQNGYGVSENADYAIRSLANYLYANMSSPAIGTTTTGIPFSDLKTVSWNNGTTDSTGTFTLPAPGVYLIVDTTNSNESLPIILSTKPNQGYTIPQSMTNYVTDTIALKDQDPQAMPVKQFVTDPTTDKTSGYLTGGTLTGSMTSTIGGQNAVTYQVSNVFPNTNGYLQYTY